MPLRFHQLDVFTDTPLAGNALAVFPEVEGLTPRTMQALAREMNLSETTFVLPSDRATRRIRFFTPTAEIPLAGHPTIGTWWLLDALGVLGDAAPDGVREVTQETGRGVLPVRIERRGGRPHRVVMTQATPEFLAEVRDRAALARVLGGGTDLLAGGPAPQVVSTAMPQLMVPVADTDRLSALPSGGRGGDLVDLLRAHGTDCAMLFTLTGDGTARCRMFAPGLGVPEDPATGSAAGALGAYLTRHDLVPAVDGVRRVTIHQGIEIGRPSRIDVEVEGTATAITAVRVGGQAVRVIEGNVTL